MIEPSPSSPNATFSGDLASLAFKTEYRSLKEEPAKLFYRPCLLNSSIYKRAVGYFRSSVYLVIGPSVVEFARRGGKVSIICSPELSDEDIDGIAAGYAQRSAIIESRLIEEIDRLLTEPSTSYQTQILATLISVGALDLKLALRSDKKESTMRRLVYSAMEWATQLASRVPQMKRGAAGTCTAISSR